MRTTGVRGKRTLCLLPLLPLFISSCIGNISTSKAMRHAAPKASPVKTVTSFSDSLSCMDDLFLVNKIKNIYISSEDIKDKAKRGKMGGGGTDMLISAISEISSNSQAIRYVGYKSSIPDFAALNAKHVPSALVIPDFYIVGSISQADDYILMNQQGLGVATSKVDTGYSYNDSVSVVAIDLNLFDVETGLQMPGITSRNSLAYTRHRKSGDVGGLILKTGVTFFVNMSRNEGPQQAVRTLLELSLVELMGKLTKLPYWDCLDLDIMAKELRDPVNKWWVRKKEEDKIQELQKLLVNIGSLDLVPNGDKDKETEAAIKEFQADNDMETDGEVSVELFLKLKSREKRGGGFFSFAKAKKVSRRSKKRSPKWDFQTEKIAGGGDVGSRASMAGGSDGIIHVAYFDSWKESLKYARKTGDEWFYDTLDGNIDTDNPEDVSIHLALDSKNRPHIIYSFRPEGGGIEIRYARYENGWKKEMIEMFAESEGRVPNTYIFFSGSDVNLVYAGDHLTHTRKSENRWVANDSYEMEEYQNLDLQKTFKKKGRVYVSYSKFNELVTAWHDGNEWSERRVHIGSEIFYPSVVADSKENLHTVGYTKEGGMMHIVARKDSGTILKKESLKKGFLGDGPVVQISSAIDPDDNIHVLYSVSSKVKNGKDAIFYLLIGKDGSKKFSLIEEGSFMGKSIIVGPSGRPHFTYYDYDKGDLKYGVLQKK